MLLAMLARVDMARWARKACVMLACWGGLGAHATEIIRQIQPIAPRIDTAITTIEVVDDRGALVHLPKAPRRVVTLLPSLTETVCAIGACDRIVATDRWSNWPASVKGLPKLGGIDDPNIEMIVAQRPDLVLVAPSSKVAARLRALKLTVAELDAQDLPQVQRLFQKVAQLLGLPRANEAPWQSLQAQIEAAGKGVPPEARGMRVYFEVASTPYAAGEVSFIGQLLSSLGAVNIVPAQLGPFPKLNPEFIVQADPELIMVAADEAPTLAARPGWQRMTAVQRKQVCAIGAADFDLMARPGPRLGLAAAALARCLSVNARAHIAKPPQEVTRGPSARPPRQITP